VQLERLPKYHKMLSIGELRQLSAARQRSKSAPAPPNTITDADSALFRSDSPLSLLDTFSIPKPPQLSDFLPNSEEVQNSDRQTSQNDEIRPLSDSKYRRLSSPSFLREEFEYSLENSEPAEKEEESVMYPKDVLLSYPVYSRYLRLLPMRDLLSLARTSTAFNNLVRTEKSRLRRHRFALVYRKDFIRYLNLSFASQKWVTERQIFGKIFSDLLMEPQHLLVFYSPDIFHYDVRTLDRHGLPQLTKPDQILEAFMKQPDMEDLRVWHFRLFSVIRPVADPVYGLASHFSLTRHELNRQHLWHSEDLAMILLPTVPDVRFVHQRLNYSNLLDIPLALRDRNGGSLMPLLFLIEKRYSPRFLLLSVRDLPQNSLSQMAFDFPIIVFESQVFEGQNSEEWMCFAGDVTVYQVALEVADRREVRDMKLNALYAQTGLTFPSSTQCWLFYFTEMWPGGTSKEIPQSDVLTLRSLFRGVPVFGGRAKRFMGNQHIPVLAGASAIGNSQSLVMRMTPTIATVVFFGRT
jgi:hypothetical protein